MSTEPSDSFPSNELTRLLPHDSASRPISTLAACGLLLQLRWTRVRNRLIRSAARTGAPRKRSLSWLQTALLLGLGATSCTALGFLLGLLHPVFGADPSRAAAHAGAYLSILCAGTLLSRLGTSSGDLNQPDGDLEWLLTLPASLVTIQAMKLVERFSFSPHAWFVLYPAVLGLLSEGRWNPWAPPLAAALCLPLLLSLAAGQVVTESVVRRWFPALLIRAVQTLGTVVSLVLTVGAWRFLREIAVLSPWLGPSWMPTTQLAALARTLARGPTLAWRHLVPYLLECGVSLGFCLLVLQSITRAGPAVGAGALQRPRGQDRQANGGRTWGHGGLSAAVLDKELKQLTRHRQAFASVILVPLVLAVICVRAASMAVGKERLLGSPEHVLALAIGVALLPLSQASSLALRLEGKALWILYTVPQPLLTLLLRKGLLAAALALAFAAAVVGYGLRYQSPSPALAGGFLYVAAGLLLLALIAVLQTVDFVRPAAIDDGAGRSVQGAWQQLLLIGLGVALGIGLYCGAWHRLSLVVLLGAVALGVWQSAHRSVPFLLEPELRAAPIVSLADGLVCAFLFFVLQLLGSSLATAQLGLGGWQATLAAFLAAAIVVVGGAVLVFRLRGVEVGPTLGLVWGPSSAATLTTGLRWGLLASGVALSFSLSLQLFPALRDAARQLVFERPIGTQRSSLVPWAVLSIVVAPLCEELIFRGMIYRGLRQSFAPGVSVVLASALFALVHPAVAAAPVFLVAVCACQAFERSHSLLSAVLVHVAYNGTLVMLAAAA